MNELIEFILSLAVADAVFILLPATVMAWIARIITERWEDGRTEEHRTDDAGDR